MSYSSIHGISSSRHSDVDTEDGEAQDSDGLLAPEDDDLGPTFILAEPPRSLRIRAFLVRVLALLCACLFSIGSHYGNYILAPLKSRLSREMGTSNTEFSLLVSAFSLNSTWTPLVGGVLASRLGTTLTSILATGLIFSGLSLLLVGDLAQDVRMMTGGMFIFGLGVSPLAVVQETIIVRFFKSHGLGLSLALGLVAGKAASFISARASYPLSEKFGPHAPFYAAASLGAVSFLVNLVYVYASPWLVSGAQTELEAPELQAAARRISIQDITEAEALEKVAKKKKVNLRDLIVLGDVFWAYIGVNVLCGALWHPFTHLAANVIEQRFELSEHRASTQASYLLAGSIFLYPIVGFIIDRVKRPYFVLTLLACSSLLTLTAYTWLALPPAWTHTAWPAIISFATGIGFSPLLLVVVVPQLVPSKYISTTLGAHKSLEQTGTVISQTIAGLILDSGSTAASGPVEGSHQDKRIQYLLNTFLVINILQFFGIFGLSYLDRRQNWAAAHQRAPRHEDSDGHAEERAPLIKSMPEATDVVSIDEYTSSPGRAVFNLGNVQGPASGSSTIITDSQTLFTSRKSFFTRRRTRRGRLFSILCAVLIISAWVLFLVTAWTRLRSRKERDGEESR